MRSHTGITCSLLVLLSINLITDTTSSDCGELTTDVVRLVALIESNPVDQCAHDEDTSTIFALTVALAAEYVIDKANNNQTDLAVPGVTYELNVEALCNNDSYATRTAALNVPHSVWTDNSFCEATATEDNGVLLGFIGPLLSANTPSVAEFMNKLHIPVITPSASLVGLSDRDKYGSLLRTITNDEEQSKALVQVAHQQMEWSFVILIHSDDEYGIQGAAKVQDYGKQKGLCFSEVIKTQLNPTDKLEHYDEVATKLHESQAKGIIYFGQESALGEIIDFYILKIRTITDRRVILASDGIGTAPDILSKMNDPRNTDKLHLVTISPFSSDIQIADLRDFMTDRLSGTRNGSVPVDNLIRQFKASCSGNDCTNKILDSSDSTLQTMQATASILQAFQNTHSSMCSSGGVCSALSNSRRFFPLMLESLKGSEVSTEIAGSNIKVKYDGNGDLDTMNNMPSYTLNVIAEREFVAISSYFTSNDSWVPDSPPELPQISSQCQSDCEQTCKKETPPYVYRRRGSEYIIAGTGSVYKRHEDNNQHDCGGAISTAGFVIMESFYLAVEKIRQKTGIDFSTLFIDTCYAKLGTHEIMNDIFISETEAKLVTGDDTAYFFSPSKFVAFIGDSTSGVSLALQTYLGLYNIPQISYRATSTWLSDSLRYPKFLRNVPSDDEQAKFMIDIVKRHGWDSIGLVNVDSVYGQTGAQLVVKYAKERGICIQYRYVTKASAQGVLNLVEDMLKAEANERLPRPIIVFAEEDTFALIFDKIKNLDSEWDERGNFLIGSETWNRVEDIIKGTGNNALGSLSFSFSEANFGWTNEEGNKFRKYLGEQRPSDNLDNPLFIKFWQQYFKCFLPEHSVFVHDTKCSSSLSLAGDPLSNDVDAIDFEDIAGKYVVMAGMSVAYAIEEAFDEKSCVNFENGPNCTRLFEGEDRDRFFELIHTTKIPSHIDGTRKEYLPYIADNGDGIPSYQVYNVQKDGSRDARYQLVYNISNGKITEVSPPLFYYAGGKVNENVVASSCTTCQCLEGTRRGSPLDQATSAPTKQVNTEWMAPGWLLPLLIVIVIFVLVLLVIAVVAVVIQSRRSKQEENPPGQYMAPSELIPGMTRSFNTLPPIPNNPPSRGNSYAMNTMSGPASSQSPSSGGSQVGGQQEEYLQPSTSLQSDVSRSRSQINNNMNPLKVHPAARISEGHYDEAESPPTSPRYADRNGLVSSAGTEYTNTPRTLDEMAQGYLTSSNLGYHHSSGSVRMEPTGAVAELGSTMAETSYRHNTDNDFDMDHLKTLNNI